MYPLVDDRNRPFIGTSLVSPEEIPCGIIETIRRELVNNRMVIPVKVTIKVKSLDGIKSIKYGRDVEIITVGFLTRTK